MKPNCEIPSNAAQPNLHILHSENIQSGNVKVSYLSERIDVDELVGNKSRMPSHSEPEKKDRLDDEKKSIQSPNSPKTQNTAFSYGVIDPSSVVLKKTQLNNNNNVLYSEIRKPKTRPPVLLKPIGLKSKRNLRNEVPSVELSSPTEVKRVPDCEELDIGHSVPSADQSGFLEVKSSPNPPDPVVSPIGSTNSLPRYASINKKLKLPSTKLISSTAEVRTINSTTEDSSFKEELPESPPYVNDFVGRGEKMYEDVYGSYPEIPNYTQMGRKKQNTHEPQVNSTEEVEHIYELVTPQTAGKNAENFETVEVIYSNLTLNSVPEEEEGPSYSSHSSSRCSSFTHQNLEAKIERTPSFYESRRVSSSRGSVSSAASTGTSSFQGIQVCYFAPQPPPEFHDSANVGSYLGNPDSPGSDGNKERLATVVNRTTGRHSVLLANSRKSLGNIEIPDVTAPPIPSEPPPPIPSEQPPSEPQSPVETKSKQKKPKSRENHILTRGAKWYEKLSCVRTGTLEPSEPYGLPGELKRRKSPTRQSQTSIFYVIHEENNESDCK